jgi:hypothetical protein
MKPPERLLRFLRNEIEQEESSGFARLVRVPDSSVMEKLHFYESLSESDKTGFIDCSAYFACTRYCFVVGRPRFDHTQHPFFGRWRSVSRMGEWLTRKSVPILRSMVGQYKMDLKRGVQSHVTTEQFEYASSIRSVKAPELRKRVRAALKPLGYYKIDELGYYCCKRGSREFRVHVDFGGRSAQLRYVVSRPEFKDIHPLSQFGFEAALGFGFGDWDFIVEENVDDVFSLLPEVVTYSYELPDRIRAAVA